MRWAGCVTRVGYRRGAYRVLVWRSEVKRPFGRPRDRWKDNIDMDLNWDGRGDMEWIGLAKEMDNW